MKIGLLARCDNRGIAYQTHEFYKHMKPHRTLVMCLNDPAWPEDQSRYDGKNVDFVNVPPDRSIDEHKARKLLREIDVLFAVETLMDWRIAQWAGQMGVRTVVQGNPEFYVHHQRPGLPSPDKWVWPTEWLLDELPEGPVLPVPTPDECPVRAKDAEDGKLKVLHVAGHAAAGDRNGTLNFMEALMHIKRDVIVTVIGQDGWLPKFTAKPNVTINLQPSGVYDRWQMYQDQHVVVLPRKYGGLCLPALEASRVGCAVVMPDCVPNHMWPGPRIPARRGRLHRAPFGAVLTYDTDPRVIAHRIDDYDKNRDELAKDMQESYIFGVSNTWEMWRERYEKELA